MQPYHPHDYLPSKYDIAFVTHGPYVYYPWGYHSYQNLLFSIIYAKHGPGCRRQTRIFTKIFWKHFNTKKRLWNLPTRYGKKIFFYINTKRYNKKLTPQFVVDLKGFVKVVEDRVKIIVPEEGC